MSPSRTEDVSMLTRTNAEYPEFGDKSNVESVCAGFDRPARSSQFGYAVSDAVLAAHATNVLNCASGAMRICVDRELIGAHEPHDCSGRGECDVAVMADQRRPNSLGWHFFRAALDWATGAKADGHSAV